jgi:hypothetical protein
MTVADVCANDFSEWLFHSLEENKNELREITSWKRDPTSLHTHMRTFNYVKIDERFSFRLIKM